MADTASTPDGALAAARKLVDQDHVFAVDLISGLGTASEPYLISKGIPVIGADIDGGPGLVTEKNMFSSFGTPNYNQVETTTGDLLKLFGATNFSAIGYGIVPGKSV